jgi:hypothetical protein
MDYDKANNKEMMEAKVLNMNGLFMFPMSTGLAK